MREDCEIKTKWREKSCARENNNSLHFVAGKNGVGETTEEMHNKLGVDVDAMRGEDFEFMYPEGLTVEDDRILLFVD